MTIQALDDKFNSLVQKDSRITSIKKKIEKGTATFSDTAEYNSRLSDMLGELLSEHITGIPEGEREKTCAYFLRQMYDDTNEICSTVQKALDKARGLNLAPQKAEYPAERVQQVAHSLEDKTVSDETIVRRANAPVSNVSKSFHDDYIQTNAQFRNNSGLKCYIVREMHGKGCNWCQNVAGRYAYGDQPGDVFRHHDNCSCTVTYENGKARQDVWTKKTWSTSSIVNPEYTPTVLTSRQANELNVKNLWVKRIDNSGGSGIIKTEVKFYKKDVDPMFEAFGRAEDSNPEELKALLQELSNMGVEINYNPTDGALAYQSIQIGKPGVISVTPNASYSAYLHEAQHAKDDMTAGWDGSRAVWDVDEHIRREQRAYTVEIELAEKMNRTDIADRLRKNLEDEIIDIKKRDEMYAAMFRND